MLTMVQLSNEILPFHLIRLNDSINKNDLQAIFLQKYIKFIDKTFSEGKTYQSAFIAILQALQHIH